MEGSAELVDVKQLDEDTHKEICFELIKVEPYLMDDTEEETVLIRPNDIKVEIEESEFSENEEVNENNLNKEMNCMSDKEEMSCDWNESAGKKTDHLAMFPVIQSEIKHECTNKGNTSTREYASPCTSTINDPTTTEKPAKLIQDNEEYFNEEIKHEEVHFELIKEETVVINDVIVDDNGLECSENKGLHEINQTTDNDSMVNEDKVPHGCAIQVDGSANIQPNRKKSNYQSVKEFRERQRVAKENFRQQFLSQSAIQVEGSANIQPNRKKSNYQSVKEFRERQRVAKENFRQQFLSQRKETAVNEPDPLALSLVAQNNKNTLSSSEALIDASPSTSIGNVIQKCGSGLTTFDNHQEQRKSCSPDKLKIHVKPSSNDGAFICNKCFYSTSKKSMLRKHHLLKHNTKSYQCKQCNYSSDRAYCLKIHARVHSGEKPYRCSMCDYSATQSSSLKTHMKVHSREKPYKCPTCDYSSAEYCKVTRHMKIHTGEKPHKCEQCNYSAAQPDSLKKHMRIHTGEKPHKCEQCNYTATQSSSIKVHVRAVHSGEKPYKCLKCDYSAYSLSKLKRHMRVHSAEKPL